MSASQPTVHPARSRAHAAPREPQPQRGRLYQAAVRRDEGLISAGGPLVVRTGSHTGRSPQDKFVVDEPASRDQSLVGRVNRPISEERYEALRERGSATSPSARPSSRTSSWGPTRRIAGRSA